MTHLYETVCCSTHLFVSQHHQGHLYQRGHGVATDATRAYHLYRSGSTSNDRRDSRKGGNRLALAGKKDVGGGGGRGRKGRKGRKGERGRRKEKDYFEKRKAHSSWVSLSFLAADLVVVFLLLLCSCRALVGFLHRCCV